MFIDHLNSMTELGIYIGDIGMRGKGFGGQAVRELLRWAFVELQLNRVFLKVAASNIAAVKTYKKCGFQEEGLLRQHYCFEGKFEDILIMGILKSEEYKCHSVQL
jgi:RimJ/RimL family protein N-acetyltransferase